MSVRSIKLNLIPILQALLNEESVARSAEKVGLSQPAMSGALARLREILDDPLLVRTGRSMRLTPRALRMRGQLDEICGKIEQLFQQERFDPATASHVFTVAAPDYLVLLLSGALLTRLREEAPGIRVRFVDVPINLSDWMQNSSIHLSVCGNFDLWPNLKYEHLFRDRVVAAVAKTHPLTSRKRLRSADLLEFPSLNYDSGFVLPQNDTKVVTGLPSLDWASQVSTAQFTDAVLLAAGSATVARAPESLVTRLSEILPLVAIELVGEETGFDTGMFWAPIHHDAQEHIWLRSVVRDCLAPLCSQPA